MEPVSDNESGDVQEQVERPSKVSKQEESLHASRVPNSNLDSVEARGRKLRSAGKKSARRKYEEESDDGEFEAPRSVKYPRGVSTKALKRAAAAAAAAEAAASGGGVVYPKGRPPVPGARPRRSVGSGRAMAPSGGTVSMPSCETILEVLERDDNIGPFLQPVDFVEYQDYLTIIQWPMDLSTVRSRLDAALHPEEAVKQQRMQLSDGQEQEEDAENQEEVAAKQEEEKEAAVAAAAAVEAKQKEEQQQQHQEEEQQRAPVPPPGMVTMGQAVVVPPSAQTVAPVQEYEPADYIRDMRLVWSNCLLYNRRGTPIYKLAKYYSGRFEEMLAQAFEGREVHHVVRSVIAQVPSAASSRSRRVGRASAKSYVEDNFGEDWWDDSEERAILAERKREKKSQTDGDGRAKLDKILASRTRQLTQKDADELNAAADAKWQEELSKFEAEKAAAVAERDGGVMDEEEEEDQADEEESIRARKPVAVKPGPRKEYLVKWEGMSYLHVEWVPHSRISKHRQKLRRFETTQESNVKEGIDEPDEPFDPRYTEVQRIIDYIRDEQGKEWYMVKWEELSYAESTWESREDVNDDAKISEYERWSKVPPAPPSRPESKGHTDLAEGLEYRNGNKLRAYQLEGLNWLTYNWTQRRGSILADEMGLGKTVQAVSLIHYLSEREHIPGPYMVACNLSTLEHWYREIREWTELNVVMYYGSREDRAVIREHEFFFKNEKGHIVHPHMRKAQIILTTYDMVTAEDWEELRAIRWACVIVDEAQRMKGKDSKFRENMMSMACDHRVLLTGTPIQNNTTELWALLNFIDPREFESLHSFQARFGTLSTSAQVSELHDLLRPFLLRRMKEDVEKSIPPKEETIVEVELTSIQKQYYRAVLEQNRSFLNKGCQGHNVPHLLNVAIQLRKVCNHPYLLRGVEDKEVNHLAENEYLETFIKASGKMVLLDKLLPKLRAGGHRVLIFSQMVKVLDLLETYLAHREWKWERIDGSVRGNDRQLAIDRFCKEDSDRFVFLLCTRAGGVGINLTAADTVVIFDSDWNPQNDVQAQARCHRIGQKEMVKVYRLITRNTYEREMFERSSRKLGLDQAVLHNMDLKADTILDGKDVEELLKFGAYDLFRQDDNDDRARQFCEADIEQILENQAVNIKYESKKMTADGSTFSKAVFQASAADRSVDLHDKDFWSLVLGTEHNATYLLDLAQTGAATESEESMGEFWKDLEAVVTNARRAWETGRAGELPADLHVLSKVLEIVSENPDFSMAQRLEAAQWHRSVITPSRRGRDDADFGVRRSNAASLRSLPASSGGGDEGNDGRWTRYERSRLQKLVVNFAAPRWGDMQRQAELTRRTEEEVKLYVLDFVRQCVRYAPDDESVETFRELLVAMEPELEGEPIPEEAECDDSLTEAQYVQFIKNKCALWARRIAETRKVHAVLEDEELEMPPFKKLLARWWSNETDLALLKAVAKHGLEADAMQRIVRDPDFPFAAHNPRLNDAAAADDEDDEDTKPTPPKRGRRGSGRKAAAAAVEESAGAKSMPPPPAVTPASSGPRDLSVEVVLDGDVRECDSLISDTRFPKDGFLWELGLPATGILQKRVTFILNGLNSYGREDEIRAEKLARKRQRKAARDRGASEWTGKEHRDLRTAVLRFGLGVSGVMAASLKLDEDAVRQNSKALNAACRALVSDEDCREPHATLFGPVSLLEGYLSDADEGVLDTKKKKKSTSKYVNDDDDEDDEDAIEGEEPVSEEYAHRFVRRLRLLQDIRERVVSHRRLGERLATAVEADMPEWWQVGVHDFYLLQQVADVGLGVAEWNSMLRKDSPFPDQATSWLSSAVEREKPLLGRLEYLRALVLNPPAVQALTARVGYQTYQPREGHRLDVDALRNE